MARSIWGLPCTALCLHDKSCHRWHRRGVQRLWLTESVMVRSTHDAAAPRPQGAAHAASPGGDWWRRAALRQSGGGGVGGELVLIWQKPRTKPCTSNRTGPDRGSNRPSPRERGGAGHGGGSPGRPRASERLRPVRAGTQSFLILLFSLMSLLLLVFGVSGFGFFFSIFKRFGGEKKIHPREGMGTPGGRG